MELLLYIIKQPQFILLFICALILRDFIKKISALKKHNNYIDKSIMKYNIYNDNKSYQFYKNNNRRDRKFTEDTYSFTQPNFTSENVAMEFMQSDVNRSFMENSNNEATRLGEESIRDVERIETPFELGGENLDIGNSFNDNSFDSAFDNNFDDNFNDNFNDGFDDSFSDGFNDSFNDGLNDGFNDSFNDGFNDPFPPMSGF